MENAASILIENVTLLSGEHTFIAISGNRISQIGGSKPTNAEKTIDAHDMIAMPAFYNTHTHSPMTVLRGYGGDKNLMDWLENFIWPAEAKLTEDDIYIGTKLACYEMIRTGTVFFNDMYWHSRGLLRALKEFHMRAVVSTTVLSVNPAYDSKCKVMKDLEIFKGFDFGDRVRLWIAPHAPYTVTDEDMRWAVEIAKEHKLGIHTHLNENEFEGAQTLEKYGKRPAFWLDDCGFFDVPAVTAHNIWLDDSEIELVAEKGATLAHCPVSNMKLTSGLGKNAAFPYLKLKKAGAKITLATDGVSSNNNLDMFEEMKFASLLAKHTSGDPTAMPAHEALKIATKAGAEAFGYDAGEIAVGKLADIILVKQDLARMQPVHDLVSNVVFSANGSCVDTTICDGKILMENGKIDGLEETIKKASEIAARIAS